MGILFVLAITPQEVISAFEEAWAGVKDYRCTLYSKELGPKGYEQGVYEYWFLKPGWIRVKVLEGKKKGSRVVYNPKTKKVTGRLGGVLGFLSITTDPWDKRVLSPRGIPLTEGSFEAALREWKGYLRAGKVWFDGEKTVDGVACWVLGVKDLDPSKNYGSVKKYLYIRKDLKLPYLALDYDASDREVVRAYFKDLKLNTGLRPEDFK